ncbi:hypothetical protein [Bradyrhizobium hipponense]|nr:hypothetical protein [Bradyrhizobium hipponense]
MADPAKSVEQMRVILAKLAEWPRQAASFLGMIPSDGLFGP